MLKPLQRNDCHRQCTEWVRASSSRQSPISCRCWACSACRCPTHSLSGSGRVCLTCMLDGSAARPRAAYAATGEDAPGAARPVARLGIVGRAADLGAGLAADGVEVTRLWGLAGVAGPRAAGWGLGVDCCVCATHTDS